MLSNNKQFFTVPEVAKIFRCSNRYVYEQVERGTLPHIRFGKKILVAEETIQRIMTEGIPAEAD